MNEEFPKVLIVANCLLNEDNATSITLKNLFSQWPKDKLALIYTSLDLNPKISDIQTFHISEVLFFKPNNSNNKGIAANLRKSGSVIKGVNGANASKSLKSSVLNFFHTLFSSHKALLPYKTDATLDRFIEQFNPDVLYSPLGSIALMRLVLNISGKFKLSVVPHFMDDWIHTMYENEPSLLLPLLTKRKLIKAIFNNVKDAIVISEKMASEYGKEFNCNFYSLMNCVPLNNKEIAIKKEFVETNIIFAYFGGLHLLRWQGLLEFCKFISNESSLASRINFNIFTSDSDRGQFEDHFAIFPFVKFNDRIEHHDVLAQMQRSDFLLHVESFDEKVKKYTRLSISTKIPEYLASKKPIIAIGPSDVASIEYLADNKCAHVIKDFDLSNAAKFSENIFSIDYNNELVANSLQLFLKFHEAEKQHLIIKDILTSSKKH